MAKRKKIEKLFKDHYQQMFRVAIALIHDDYIAHDIIHDIFLKLLEIDNISDITHAYLISAVRNRALNHIRNCETRQRIANLYFLHIEDYESEDWPNQETMSRISEIIRTELSSQAKRVVELRFGYGLSFAEISSTMGISESAIYRHMNKAITILQQKLKKYE